MAKSAAKQETHGKPVAEAAPEKKSRLPKILIALAILAAGGAAGWYAMEKPFAAPHPATAEEKPPLFVALEPFTVNLQPENGDQYLQVSLVLKVTEPAAADAVKLHMPEIRNRILLLLSSKMASEVSTVTGKRQLSAEIMKEAKPPTAPQTIQSGIIGVFFTSFVIQ